MPTVDLDFGSVGQIPPEGVWRTLCNTATYKKNKAGDGYILDLDVSLIDMPEEHSNFEGFKPFPRPVASFKSSALWKLQEILEAFTGEEWTDDDMKLEIDEDNTVPILAGQTAMVVYIHDSYNGRATFKANTFMADDGSVTPGEQAGENSNQL